MTPLCILKLHVPLIDCINVANSLKTNTIIISRYRTPHSPLTLCELDLEISSSFEFLGVTFDDKLTFEKHICNIACSIAQKTIPICKCYKILGNNDAVLKSFYAFILPCFESVHLFGTLHLTLSMLYKFLHNIDRPLNCKHPQFAKPICIT